MDSGHDRPRVSFIVPAFNPGAKWLRQSIESVLSAMEDLMDVNELLRLDSDGRGGHVKSGKETRRRFRRNDRSGTDGHGLRCGK